jgi:hypothetical protein
MKRQNDIQNEETQSRSIILPCPIKSWFFDQFILVRNSSMSCRPYILFIIGLVNPVGFKKYICEPPNSGYINCNGPNIHNITNSTYATIDLGSLTCEAKAKSVFPPIWFDSWSGDLASRDSDRDHTITFEPTHFGTLCFTD